MFSVSQTSIFPRDPGQGKRTNLAIMLCLKVSNIEGRPLTCLSFYSTYGKGFQHGRKPTNMAINLQHSKLGRPQSWLSFYSTQCFQHGGKHTNLAIIGIWPFYTTLTWKTYRYTRGFVVTLVYQSVTQTSFFVLAHANLIYRNWRKPPRISPFKSMR